MSEQKWRSKFDVLVKKTHSDQAIWWLNGYWTRGASDEAEKIYQNCQKFKEVEYGSVIPVFKGKAAETKKELAYVEGNDLDEAKSHKFLEQLGETLTALELRKRLEKIDIDKNHRMAISEYLLFKYAKEPQELVDSPQGDNSKAVDAAKAKMDEVREAMDQVSTKMEQQKEQKALADAAIIEAKRAEDESAAAEAELKAAVAELKKQEDEYHAKLSALEAKSNDESISNMQRSKAKNELAQHKAEDPLPLRKAKTTQEAALRKAEKKKAAAEKATQAAHDTAAKLAEAIKETEAALVDLQVKFEAAEKELEVQKMKGGVAQGAIWWMQRELTEARKYMPNRK